MKLLAALLLTGKLGAVLKTGGTMLLSVFVYAFSYGWTYAIGVVGLLFVHEMGHFIAARQRGLHVGAPCFIPFVGAWIELKEQPMNAETEAFVAIAGPMLGSAAAFVLYLFGHQWGAPTLFALSYAGFILNLFNLIPLSPLDGGRIVGVVSPRLWFIGLPLLAALFFWKPSPLLVLIAIMALPQLWSALKGGTQENTYYQTPLAIRLKYALHYFILAILLALMAFEVHQRLP